MGVTYIKSGIAGESDTREYHFLVAEEGEQIGLTHAESDEVRRGSRRIPERFRE